MRRPTSLGVFLTLFLLFGQLWALDPTRQISQYAHTAWGPKDGAPPGPVRALAQSTDGYLWLGSPDGLYRFDGVVFERYQPQSGGPFPARGVFALLALPNGDLWIGFRGAISLLRNGNVTNYTTRDGVPAGRVWSFAEDREGTIWAATGSGLALLEGNRWNEVGKDWNFPGKAASAIFLDRQGTLWVATEDTLVFLPPGARRFQLTGIAVGEVLQIAEAANGKLWMAETTRSVRPIPLSDKQQPPDETEVQVGSVGILFDNNGALWITSEGDGLRLAPVPELLRGKIKEFGTAVESFTAKDGLSDDVVLAIFQDREGNIWVGTNNGLDRFRKTNLVPLVLPFKPKQAVLAAGDAGDAWVENLGSIVRVHGGRVDREHPIPTEAISAYRDPAGAIWWLNRAAIYRYDAGKYITVALPPSFRKHPQGWIMATGGGSGVLWLSAEREGLFYRKTTEWQQLEPASEFAKLAPVTAFTDWMDRAWFGYEGGTIILLKDKNIQRVFHADDSPVRGVWAINGRGRHTWVGGAGGLAFFDGNRFRRIIPADTEAFGLVMGIEETPDGSLWLAESRGVVQVPASEVQQALDNPSYRVKYRIFDSFDGLPGTFAGSLTNSRVIQGTDGRLWFAASGGIVWVDPANILTNALPPPVVIRSVKANTRQSGSLANLVLPPRTTDLQIDYTALSLAVPEKVRFRYRLEGVNKDWQDAGARREAIYTRLGPGEYHFRVIACNNDGVWNDTGATLKFSIAPAWFQTKSFLLLCIVSASFVAWVLYRMRMRQVAMAMSTRFDERLAERTRMARELHDTFLQTIQGSKLVVDDALKQPGDHDRMHRAMEQLAVWLDQAMHEGRAALNSLRTSTTQGNDLSAALQRAAEECRLQGSMEIVFSVTGATQPIHPAVGDEIYRIGYEAIRNACIHSKASRLEISLRYDRELALRVIDNGVGIDPFTANHGRDGHFGIPGMRERAIRIGSRLTVASPPNFGTEITLVVPGKIIFTAPGVGFFAKLKAMVKGKNSRSISE